MRTQEPWKVLEQGSVVIRPTAEWPSGCSAEVCVGTTETALAVVQVGGLEGLGGGVEDGEQ